ncbi:GNAT family N-acetyltransferase [Aeromonas dhakensis]|nr:GNAT family protein [Aeromonas dhakensis]MDH0174120.1 GNAT family N-acetyltransferase [Aeromonas dhakensis]MDX7740384.1 GNAT family protein [Aeromonas dhakensis]USP10826.1 GNAT family N-acetyltransferase [Aeromonas dhakensis]
MSEALGLLFAHASTLGVTSLTTDIDADNIRYIALFEKLGFKAHAGRYQRMLPLSDPRSEPQRSRLSGCCGKEKT